MNQEIVDLLALLSILSACSATTTKSLDNKPPPTSVSSPITTTVNNTTPSPVAIKQSKEIATQGKSIINGRYILGGTEEVLQVKTTRYRYGNESDNAEQWKQILGLKYVKTGVVFDGKNYWCLAKSSPNSPSVCTADGWMTHKQQLEKAETTSLPSSDKQPESKPSETLLTEQFNGTWQKTAGGTMKVLSLGKQQLKIEFSSVSPSGNVGQGQGVASINGNTATLKPENADETCQINLNFTNKELVVSQDGQCGFGLNVTVAGNYKRGN
jgi:hypothetical protein